MDVKELNAALLSPDVDPSAILPHVAELARAPYEFRMEFGLESLPREPGFLAIRGARQYGKSTWLEQGLCRTLADHGPGSALYLNGDLIGSSADLVDAIRTLVPLFHPRAPVRRLFIDEITSIGDWQRAIKGLIDGGDLREVLVVTTGSRATDLRRGAERLPGRKGRLPRTTFLFTPVTYAEFRRVCASVLGERTLETYLLSGGSPVALRELADTGRIPEYVVEMTRDWVRGECAASGRDRASLVAVLEQIYRFGGTPVGQAKLAREAGLANNTVAQGYVELLADLGAVGVARAWDPDRRVAVRRRRAKFPFINLLVALAWGPGRLRSVGDFRGLPARDQGRWWEWLAGQELWRRAAVRGEEAPEELLYWQSRDHELDYVSAPGHYLEVKGGSSNPVEFAWFTRSFPRGELNVITTTPFEASRMRGITMGGFLLSEGAG
jgi:predicted AAA+ superfamily ATPase